jgi:hypothetical protein
MKDKIKGISKLFYNAPAEAPEVIEQPTEQPVMVTNGLGQTTYQQPITYVNPGMQQQVTINPKHWEILDDAVNKEDLPGPDFLEFKKAVAALAALPLPETHKYQAAYAPLAATGLTVDKMKSSAKHYVSVIEREMSHFDAEMNDMRAEHILIPEQAIESDNMTITALNEEIQDRINKINEINTSIAQRRTEIENKKAEIENIAATFKYTADQYIQNINTDIQKIDAYITNIQ